MRETLGATEGLNPYNGERIWRLWHVRTWTTIVDAPGSSFTSLVRKPLFKAT